LPEGCPLGILAFVAQSSGGDMESTSQYPKWMPYEIKAASIHYERRSEDLQLEQLRLRLQKQMQEAEARAAETTAA
jgi:hypothetical protein